MLNAKRSLPVPLGAADVRRLAVKADVDPRTLLRVAAGEPVKGMAARRARSVLLAEAYPIPDAGASVSGGK